MSRITLQRIERGEPSVTMGAYMSALAVVGLDLELAGNETVLRRTAGLPRKIPLADFPQLKKVAWQLGDTAALTPKEALGFYERNWRHIDRAAMTSQELDLVRRLTRTFGREPLV